MRKIVSMGLLGLCLTAQSIASSDAGAFKIQSIKFEGLQRISQSTVMTYLPVHVGDQLTTSESNTVIQALYRTDFFSNISLARQGNTLIIQVHERPVIGAINIKGNSDIPTKQLKKVLNNIGITEGHVYNKALLKELKQSLQDEYYSRGKYNARVDVSVLDEPRNRVGINITISEGVAAVIHNINIIGNHAFKTKTLLEQLSISTPGWFSWLTDDDAYTRTKLEASIAALSAYYMDRGYILFQVDSAQVGLTPDRKSVYITINVTEGPKFTFSGYHLVGNLILPRKQLQKLVTFKGGQTFSRQQVINTDKAIVDKLGDHGYAYANVQAEPKIDKKNRTVFITLKVVPGKKTYVQQIHFYGNTSVNDRVLRRAMRQMEGGVWNTEHVKQSKWRLNQLPYITNVQMSTERVPGSDDKLDMNYKITEKNSANFTASLGYSQLDGILFSTGVMEHNFLGTGKTVGFNLSRSRGYQSYSFNYVNPYYTLNGVSRAVNLYYTKVDPGKVNLTDSYSVSTSGVDVSYNIPISEYLEVENDINLGYGFQNTILNTGSGLPTEVSDFVNDHGRHFGQVNFTGGWSSNGFDRVVFPTNGFTQSVNALLAAPVTSKTIGYYTLSYKAQLYHPITKNRHFLWDLSGSVDYGNGYMRSSQMPFYDNFYAGGIGSVRGYEGNTLGPKDSNGDPIGGNFSAVASLGIVIPNPISPNSLRTTYFVDAGNVYNTHDQNYSSMLGKLRYSTGIEFDWMTPIGTINFSLAKALNPKHGDSTQFFQFSVGKTF